MKRLYKVEAGERRYWCYGCRCYLPLSSFEIKRSRNPYTSCKSCRQKQGMLRKVKGSAPIN